MTSVHTSKPKTEAKKAAVGDTSARPPEPTAEDGPAARDTNETKDVGRRTRERSRNRGTAKGLLTGRSRLYGEIENYLLEHSSFESSAAHEETMRDIAGAPAMQDIFAAPMKHRILDLEGSLKFILFLRLAEERMDKRAGGRGNIRPLAAGERLDVAAALNAIISCYTEGTRSLEYGSDSDSD
jgi:hypothetical protein